MLWDLAFKHLWQRRLRSALTILGVAIILQTHLVINGFKYSYEQDVQRQLSAFAGKVLVRQDTGDSLSAADFSLTGSSLAEATAQALLALPGIDAQASSAVLMAPLARSVAPTIPVAILVVGIQPGHEAAYLSGFQAGEGTASLAAPNSAILGQSVAKLLSLAGETQPLAVGDSFELQGKTFQVAGVLESAPALYNNSVLIPLDTAQEVFERPGTVSAVILRAAQVEDTAPIQAAVEAGFPGLLAISAQQMVASVDAILVDIRNFSNLLTTTVAGVAVVIITIVVIVAVMEQRKEIGTLRAIGARRWRIFGLVAGQALALCLLGALLALPIALAFLKWGMQWQDFDLIFVYWAQNLGWAALIGVLAALLPAWQAVRVDPLEALRYE
jgi:putative ABC transport system permease protein